MSKTDNACFISYAHQGMDRDTFDYIVKTFKDKCEPRVKILVDLDLKIGHDFKNFTEVLNFVSSVVIFYSPEFKQKTEDRKGGVFDEFKEIMARYYQEDEGNRTFELIPILIAGNIGSSVPEELLSIKYLDLTKFRVKREITGEFKVSRLDRMNVLPKLREVGNQIMSSAVLESDEYKILAKEYDDLFVDLKASWNRNIEGHGHIENLFVKTRSFYKIIRQQAFFMVGRKGSGKTTLTQVMPLLIVSSYLSVIGINADDFDLEAHFSLYSDSQFRSDTTMVIQRQKAFEYTWEAVLMLALMQEIVKNVDEIEFQRGNRAGLIQPLMIFINNIDNNITKENGKKLLTSDYFNFCFVKMVEFVRDCINGARNDPDFFLPDVAARFNLKKYINFVFGNEVSEALWGLLRIFERKFLVTLDGFDDAFEEFRKNSIRSYDQENLRRRSYFEIDWLRSLLSFTIKAKSSSENYLYSAIDFCVVAPMDRFMEVIRYDRDSYRNWNRWFTIQWSGIELAILLRKRLESLVNSYSDKKLDPRDRLELILKHPQFNHIPSDIEFEHNGKKYMLPLFMYVLRYTFWRPRGLLLCYSKILALSENLRRWNTQITSDSLQNCVRSTTTKIIESEFFAEFRSTVVNIEEIICLFRKEKCEMDFNHLRTIISKANFKFATGDLSERDLVEKISFLYNIGFLGIKVNEKQKKDLGLWYNYAFIFNEGQTIFSDRFVNDGDLQDYSFVIHPIFTYYLHLNCSETEFYLVYDWDYLRKAEAALISRE